MQVQKSPEPEVLSTQEDLFDQSNKTGTNCLIRAILLLLQLSHFSRVWLCQNVAVFVDNAFREVIQLNEAIRVKPNPIWLVSLGDEIWTHRKISEAYPQRTKAMWGHSEKVAICKALERVSERNQTCKNLDLRPQFSSSHSIMFYEKEKIRWTKTYIKEMAIC